MSAVALNHFLLTVKPTNTPVTKEDGDNKDPCTSVRGIKLIRGDSMGPLLSEGDEVIVEDGYYACHEIERGDIVEIEYPYRETNIVKFVKGIPGDTLSIHEGVSGWGVVVNGNEVVTSENKPYALSREQIQKIDAYIQSYQGIIPPQYYLIMGNLPEGSLDSSVYGLFWKGSIVGKVLVNSL